MIRAGFGIPSSPFLKIIFLDHLYYYFILPTDRPSKRQHLIALFSYNNYGNKVS